jgi:hypothetical protein
MRRTPTLAQERAEAFADYYNHFFKWDPTGHAALSPEGARDAPPQREKAARSRDRTPPRERMQAELSALQATAHTTEGELRTARAQVAALEQAKTQNALAQTQLRARMAADHNATQARLQLLPDQVLGLVLRMLSVRSLGRLRQACQRLACCDCVQDAIRHVMKGVTLEQRRLSQLLRGQGLGCYVSRPPPCAPVGNEPVEKLWPRKARVDAGANVAELGAQVATLLVASGRRWTPKTTCALDLSTGCAVWEDLAVRLARNMLSDYDTKMRPAIDAIARIMGVNALPAFGAARAGHWTPPHRHAPFNVGNILLVGEKEWCFWKPNRRRAPSTFAQWQRDGGAAHIDAPDVTLTQRAGELIWFPAGWWHSVRTLSGGEGDLAGVAPHWVSWSLSQRAGLQQLIPLLLDVDRENQAGGVLGAEKKTKLWRAMRAYVSA